MSYHGNPVLVTKNSSDFSRVVKVSEYKTFKKLRRQHSRASLSNTYTIHAGSSLVHPSRISLSRSCGQPRQRRDDLRNPADNLGGPDRDLATGGRSLARGVRLGVGVRETAGDGERSPSDARVSARGRIVEMGLDVGGVSLDFQHDIRGKEESCGVVSNGWI